MTNEKSKVQNLFTKRGFWETINILDHEPITLKLFYLSLSYYNAFYRTKNLLIRKDIVNVYKDDDKIKMIELTEKGEKIKSALDYISELLN